MCWNVKMNDITEWWLEIVCCLYSRFCTPSSFVLIPYSNFLYNHQPARIQVEKKNVIQIFNHAICSGISIGSSAWGGGRVVGYWTQSEYLLTWCLLSTSTFLIFLISGCPGLRGWLSCPVQARDGVRRTGTVTRLYGRPVSGTKSLGLVSAPGRTRAPPASQSIGIPLRWSILVWTVTKYFLNFLK